MQSKITQVKEETCKNIPTVDLNGQDNGFLQEMFIADGKPYAIFRQPNPELSKGTICTKCAALAMSALKGR